MGNRSNLWLITLLVHIATISCVIKTIDNSNYVSLIKEASNHNLTVACVDGKRNDMAVSFLMTWVEVANKHKNYSEFAYCNSYEADGFVQAVGIDKLPAIVVISKGMAYHAYGERNFTDKVFLGKFIMQFKQMKHKATKIPELTENPKAEEEQKVTEEDVLKQIMRGEIMQLVASKIKTVFGADNKDITCWIIILLLVPAVCGIFFAIFGMVIEKLLLSDAGTKKKEEVGADKKAK